MKPLSATVERSGSVSRAVLRATGVVWGHNKAAAVPGGLKGEPRSRRRSVVWATP